MKGITVKEALESMRKFCSAGITIGKGTLSVARVERQYFFSKQKTNFMLWLARRLPRTIIYFVLIHAGATYTTDEVDGKCCNPMSVNLKELLDYFGEK